MGKGRGRSRSPRGGHAAALLGDVAASMRELPSWGEPIDLFFTLPNERAEAIGIDFLQNIGKRIGNVTVEIQPDGGETSVLAVNGPPLQAYTAHTMVMKRYHAIDDMLKEDAADAAEMEELQKQHEDIEQQFQEKKLVLGGVVSPAPMTDEDSTLVELLRTTLTDLAEMPNNLGEQLIECSLPRGKVKPLIGQKGAHIQHVRKAARADLHFEEPDPKDEDQLQTLRIKAQPMSAYKAHAMMMRKFHELDQEVVQEELKNLSNQVTELHRKMNANQARKKARQAELG